MWNKDQISIIIISSHGYWWGFGVWNDTNGSLDKFDGWFKLPTTIYETIGIGIVAGSPKELLRLKIYNLVACDNIDSFGWLVLLI